jgi:hypothetical protein
MLHSGRFISGGWPHPKKALPIEVELTTAAAQGNI